MKSRIWPENVKVESMKLTKSSPLYKQVVNFEFAKLGRFMIGLHLGSFTWV